MRRVIIKLIKLIDLSKSIPCPKVSIIDIHSGSVAFNRRIRIFQLQILMAHQRPGTEVLLVKLDSPLKVDNRLVVVATQAVVVTYCAASLRAIFVVVEYVVGQVCQFAEVFLDVEDV